MVGQEDGEKEGEDFSSDPSLKAIKDKGQRVSRKRVYIDTLSDEEANPK